MGKTATTKTTASDPIVAMLTDLITPVIQALEATNPYGAGSQDTGHTKPTDAALKWFFRSWCQTCHHQLYGLIKMPDGRVFRNAKEQVDESQNRFANLVRKHGEDDEAIISDPDYHRITAWFRKNEASFDVFKSLLSIGEQMYAEVSNGDKFEYRAPQQTQVQAAMSNAVTKEAKSTLAELKKKVA